LLNDGSLKNRWFVLRHIARHAARLLAKANNLCKS